MNASGDMTTLYGDFAQVYTALSVAYGQSCNTVRVGALCVAGDMINPNTQSSLGTDYYSGCVVEEAPPSESPRCDANTGATDIPYNECAVLEKLYNDTNGAGWNNSTNWLSSTTICNNM
jgi:hypothetical protein